MIERLKIRILHTIMKTIRLAIIDRQPIFLEGLSAVLSPMSEIEIAATTQTAKEMFARLKRGAAHVLLTDVNFTHKNGLNVIPEFKQRYPRLKIIALSTHKQRGFVDDVIERGGDGYLLKSTTKEELITSIHQVVKGETYIDTSICVPVQSGEIDYTQSPIAREQFLKEHKLTRREVDVISLIAQSYTSKEIANLLHISEFTVKTHRRNLKKKLHLSKTSDIVRFALQTGIVSA